MPDLDDYGITLTARELDLLLDVLDAAEVEEPDDADAEAIADLRQKITQQTGVK